MTRRFPLALAAALTFGCTEDKSAGSDTGGDTGSGPGSSTGGEMLPTDTSDSTPQTDDGAMTSGSDDSTGGSGQSGFIEQPDGGGVSVECDIWNNDCPSGEKCMPWANDGGNSWNATKCSPLDPNPAQVGDECTVEGSGVSGIDNCDVHSMCYYVDPETNMGICVSFCQGSAQNPICNPGFVCTIVNNGVLILCRPECDPLLQDCIANQACLPATGSDRFTCIIDASGEMGAAGDPCEYINACDPGLFCASAEAVPGCAGSQGCCSEFCDINDPDPNSYCTLGGGQECVPWYEEGTAPPGFDHVGACAIPA